MCVIAIRIILCLQGIDVRIKWPNDVYFGATMKLGGILVKSSIMHDTIHANIGMCCISSQQVIMICIHHMYAFACIHF